MNDLISRQAAIDVIETTSFDDYGDYVRIRELIEELPSAQHETTLDDVKEYCFKRCLIVVTSDLYNEMVRRWSASSQPEIVRCKECKHRPSGDEENHNIEFPDNLCPCQCEDFWYSWIPSDDWFCGNGERRGR